MAPAEKAVPTDVPELHDFAVDLRKLRSASGLSYPAMAREADCTASVLSRAAAGHVLPSWPVTERYVLTCGGNTDEWRQRWLGVRSALAGRDDDLATPPTTSVALLKQLRRRIEASGRSQRAIADAAHLSRTTVSTGLSSYSLPPLEFITAILAALDATPSEIATWTGWHNALQPRAEAPRLPAQKRHVMPHLVLLLLVGVVALGTYSWLIPDAPAGEAAAPAIHLESAAGRDEPQIVAISTPPPAGRPTRNTPSRAERRPTAKPVTAATATAPSRRPPPKVPIVIAKRVKAVVDVAKPGEGQILDKDQKTSIRCVSTKGATNGYYYTDGGYYLKRDDFEYGDGSDRPLLTCDQVNFPEKTPSPSPSSSPTIAAEVSPTPSTPTPTPSPTP